MNEKPKIINLNLGTGIGYSVLQLIRTFERVNKIDYSALNDSSNINLLQSNFYTTSKADIENKNVQMVLPWIDWAYEKVKSDHNK